MSSWIWWAVGTFGLGTLALVAVGFVFGWPLIVGTKPGRMALAVLTAGLGALGLYFAGRRKGRALERAKLKAKIDREVAGAKAEAERIDRLTDEEVDRELARWDRT